MTVLIPKKRVFVRSDGWVRKGSFLALRKRSALRARTGRQNFVAMREEEGRRRKEEMKVYLSQYYKDTEERVKLQKTTKERWQTRA